ncbi:MAG: hypothetical protein DRH44_05980 [Candidatus Coatesbacteria bacterium]|nr:MAG: hypothetical protein DRH44_05980 [Candidatus Coatesbacteria bacterium]
MALDSEDRPHIACDEWHDLGAWYIWYGEPLNDITLLSFTADPSGASAVNLRWSISTDEGDNISGFNLYRRELQEGAIHELRIQPGDVGEAPVRENYNSPLQRDNIPDWQRVNSTIITGTNPYSYTDTGVAENTQYEYKLEAVRDGDDSETIGTTMVETGTPASFGIVRLYPNPASDIVNCILRVPKPCEVNIAIYDISGRRVMERVTEVEGCGEAELYIEVSGLSSGIYTLNASDGDNSTSERFVIVK